MDILKSNIIVGVSAALAVTVLAPVLVPVMVTVGRPLAKSLLKGGLMLYEKSREAVAMAGESVEDLVAEIRAEEATRGAGAEPAPSQGSAMPRSGAESAAPPSGTASAAPSPGPEPGMPVPAAAGAAGPVRANTNGESTFGDPRKPKPGVAAT